VAVFISVLLALTLLPACLAVLKDGINGLAGFTHKTFLQKTKPWKGWHKLALMVVHHRIFFILCTLVLLLCFGYPFLSVRLGISDLHILPAQTPGYQFLQAYEKRFDANELTPIFMVVQTKQGRILSSENIEKLYRLTQRLKRNSRIKEVSGVVSISDRLTLSQYQTLYRLPKHLLAPGMQQMLKISTGRDFTVITIVSRHNANSAKTMKLIKQLRHMNPGKGLELHLTGEPVNNSDVMHSIGRIFPYMLIWIMSLTYLILLILLRSLFLPFKAIVVNILSLCASYGVLVYVFQEGHFHQFLHFNPQGMLDISLLIIIFCALFGFSMDYEVFLLTRIKEGYDETGDTNQGIIFGIEKSSKIISSAAIIVIILCGSFMLADVLMVKEFGLGIAVAIFVDAFIIRILLVPAIMSLVQSWNWYLPKWMDRLF
ncbi:MAG: MMPL family transporter, partial [Methylococcales bacterium]|nr:MMPL family transporter [Methylococcales bacterium]